MPDPGSFLVNNQLAPTSGGGCAGFVNTTYNPLALDYATRWTLQLHSNCSVTPHWWRAVDGVPASYFGHWEGYVHDGIDPAGNRVTTTWTYSAPNDCPTYNPNEPVQLTPAAGWIPNPITTRGSDDGCRIIAKGGFAIYTPIYRTHELKVWMGKGAMRDCDGDFQENGYEDWGKIPVDCWFYQDSDISTPGIQPPEWNDPEELPIVPSLDTRQFMIQQE